MQNLHKLKQSEHFGLSVTDNFTINERKRIKEKFQEAKNFNEGNNGDFVLRVRGNPRTRLCLVQKARIPTKEPDQSL